MSAVSDLNEINITLAVALEQRKKYETKAANGSLASLSPIEQRHWQGQRESNEAIIRQCLQRIAARLPRVAQEIANRKAIEKGRPPEPCPESLVYEAMANVSHSLTRKAQAQEATG